jgi:hypothetical protein
MGDFIIHTGDLLRVTIVPPVIIPLLQAPVALTGSSRDLTINGLPACLLGDELPLPLQEPLPYTAAPFAIPGTGTLRLTLSPANLSVQTRNGKPLLLKGSVFTALFTVATPATQATPSGPVADPVAIKTGTAEFITTNATVKAA